MPDSIPRPAPGGSRLAAGLLALALAGCGGSTTPLATPLSPSASATVITTETIPLAAAANIQAPAIEQRDVEIPGAGQVDVRMDWTNSVNDIDLIVTNTSCPDGVAAYNGNCTVYGRDQTTLTPAAAQFRLTTATAIRIWIYNFGNQAETGTLTVYLGP